MSAWAPGLAPWWGRGVGGQEGREWGWMAERRAGAETREEWGGQLGTRGIGLSADVSNSGVMGGY